MKQLSTTEIKEVWKKFKDNHIQPWTDFETFKD